MYNEYRRRFCRLEMSARSTAPDLEGDPHSVSRIDARKTRRKPVGGLVSKLMALKQRHGQLQDEIDTQMRRPLPDPLIAQKLKRPRLRLKDEIECIAGVLRTVRRPSPAGLPA